MLWSSSTRIIVSWKYFTGIIVLWSSEGLEMAVWESRIILIEVGAREGYRGI